METRLTCKVCYNAIEYEFTADEINNGITLFVVPCKHCAEKVRKVVDGIIAMIPNGTPAVASAKMEAGE